MIPDNAELAGDHKCFSDYDGHFIEILVADDGPGIPAESLSKVFDPFYSASSARNGTGSEPAHGAGLGLYIVQEIVREHDGCLAITSQPGKGTQIIVLLPAEEHDDV